jgi:biotin carboxyl carrier protein
MKTYRVTVNGQSYDVQVEEVGPNGLPSRPTPPPPAAQQAGKTAKKARGSERPIPAPIPGKVVAVKVKVGQVVKTSSVLVVLDAMKMENDLLSPADGTVKAVKVQPGDAVNAGDLLVVIE